MATVRVDDRLIGRRGRDTIAVPAVRALTVMVPAVVAVTAPVAAVAAVQKDVQEGTGEDQQEWQRTKDVRPVLGGEEESCDEQEAGGGERRSERGGGGHGVGGSGERDHDRARPARSRDVPSSAEANRSARVHGRQQRPAASGRANSICAMPICAVAKAWAEAAM